MLRRGRGDPDVGHPVRRGLGISPESLAAEKAYGNVSLLGRLVGQSITPCAPVIDHTRQRDDFFTYQGNHRMTRGSVYVGKQSTFLDC